MTSAEFVDFLGIYARLSWRARQAILDRDVASADQLQDRLVFPEDFPMGCGPKTRVEIERLKIRIRDDRNLYYTKLQAWKAERQLSESIARAIYGDPGEHSGQIASLALVRKPPG